MEITIPSQFQYVLFFSFLLFLVIVSLRRSKKSARNNQLPPSPPSLPVIGHLHLLSSTLHISFKNLPSSYGPFMLIRSGGATQYVVSNGTIAKEIFKTHDISFAARPEFGSSDNLICKATSFASLDYSKHWIFLKKICMMEILSAKQISRLIDVRKEERIKLLEVITEKAENGEACDLGIELMAMMNNIICRMIMSTRCSEDANEAMEIREVAKGISSLSGLLGLGEAFSLVKKYDLFGAGRKVRALLMRFDALMDGIILKHEKERENGERKRKDMMDILLSICEDSEAEVKLTKMDIEGLFLTILDHKLKPKSDIPNLPYLQAVVKETLRLHPSLPLVFRKCREDCEINNYPIAKNSRIVVNSYAVNRDPDVWENAADFVPERFLVNSKNASSHDDSEDVKGQNFSYVRFGGGRRGCPGAGFATAVVQVTLAGLIQCFDWKIKGNEKVNMKEEAGFSAGMANPLVCYPLLRVDLSVLRAMK